MKIEEAIQTLKDIYPSQKQIVTGEYPHVAESIDLAIETLEKQIPKKPIYKFTDNTGDMFYDCQVCGEYVTHSGTQAKKNFCSNCGQKIDWSEVENE